MSLVERLALPFWQIEKQLLKKTVVKVDATLLL